MIVRDKQDLRKCVKQSVRRAPVTETAACLSVFSGGYGVENWLNMNAEHEKEHELSLQKRFESAGFGSPFSSPCCELLAALDALNLPTHDLDKAETIIHGHDSASYLSQVLGALRTRRILAVTDGEMEDEVCFEDERVKPLLTVQTDTFIPGRYGVDYAGHAQRLEQRVQRIGARDIVLDRFDADALCYCVIPVCEDTGSVLHIHLESLEQWQAFQDLLSAHPELKVLMSADEAIESALLPKMEVRKNLLLCIGNAANLPVALERLGIWFVPFASRAKTPEELLGKWIRAKEHIWQSLSDAYLPLARTGYELTREQIEADAELLLGGNLEKFYL